MNNVMFDNYKLLFIMIPLVIIVTIPFVMVLKKKSLRWYNLCSLFVHFIICVLLTLSLANIKTTKTETKTSIYIVADVLGHKDVNTTKKHYAAISDDIRRKASTAVSLRN